MRKISLLVIFLLSFSGWALSQEVEGLTPSEAFNLTQKAGAYLVDVRTIAEYVYVGHPENAYCIPLLFWNEEKQTQVPNRDFPSDLTSKFKKEDTLIFICRSGNRSLRAARMALSVGFKRVYNVLEGFEGKKDDKGYRAVGGWKNRDLPYTYDLNKPFLYIK